MAERKTWIHGFYNNTFNASTQLWELRDSRNDALMAEGPKADKLGKFGSAMTRQEKAWDKVRNLERQLELAKAAYSKAYTKMTDLQFSLEYEEENTKADVTSLMEMTRKSLLRKAKQRNIVGRHDMSKADLANALSID